MGNIYVVRQTLLHTEWYQDEVSKFSGRSLKHWACPKTPQWVPLPHNAVCTCNFVADYSKNLSRATPPSTSVFRFSLFLPFFDYVFPYLPPCHFLSTRHLRSSVTIRSVGGELDTDVSAQPISPIFNGQAVQELPDP
jgi:hypothetical protein